MGSDRLVAARYYDGLIDEMAVFSSALTPTQVANIFAGVQNTPSLSIAQDGSHIVVAWPAQFAGFTLTSTPTLGPSASWGAVPGTPVQADGYHKVTLPATAAAAFYRLQQSGK